MFYCGLMKVEKLKKCNVSNAGIAHYIISAGILVCRISDRFPYFLRLDYGQIKRVLPPRIIRERPINDVNLQNFKSDIINSHLLDRINADTNDIDVKYDILHDTLTNAINKHIPVKTVKFDKHKHRKSHWIIRNY